MRVMTPRLKVFVNEQCKLSVVTTTKMAGDFDLLCIVCRSELHDLISLD